jgi:hypothetical protein
MRAVIKILFLVIAARFPAHSHASEGPDAAFSLSWTNGILRVSSPKLPSGKLEILYLEAFCRSGAHNRSWNQTKIPHRTTLLRVAADGRRLEFETTVADKVVVRHDVLAERDSIRFSYTLKNPSQEALDVQWFQPACIRVAEFCGRDQQTYTGKSFVFTERGLTRLDQLARTTNALYLGGQVYLPKHTKPEHANPRPLCEDRITNGLIGCISGDGKHILAAASSTTHELFEGVYVCLHSDPYIGGLAAGETRTVTSRLYLLPNDPDALLKRYQRDFPGPFSP